MKTPIFLSLGSNINKAQSMQRALDVLASTFGEIAISSMFESEAVDFESDCFFNCVVAAYTDLPLTELLTNLRQIEFDFGRRLDAKKNEPRALDIDLLLFGDHYLLSPVKLPREDIATRAFVLEPLVELIPHWCHPETHLTIAEMWSRFDKQAQPQKKVEFLWAGQQLPHSSLAELPGIFTNRS